MDGKRFIYDSEVGFIDNQQCGGDTVNNKEVEDKLNAFDEENINLKASLYLKSREKEELFKHYHDLSMSRYNAIGLIEDMLHDLNKDSSFKYDSEELVKKLEKMKRYLLKYDFY